MAVRVESSERVGSIVIDRPDKRNAVDLETLREILEAQQQILQAGRRLLLVRGTPPAFCSGADLDGAELGEFTDVLGSVLRGFTSWRGITVAYVDGPALGAGLQIAAACDIRIATTRSVFGIPAAKLGLAVDSWTVERLVREVGWSTARTMLLTGDPVDGSEVPKGFLARVIDSMDADSALAQAMEIVDQWAARAPLTVDAHKLAIERAAGSEISVQDVERARLAAWSSRDAVEGRSAFRERRPPEFLGE